MDIFCFKLVWNWLQLKKKPTRKTLLLELVANFCFIHHLPYRCRINPRLQHVWLMALNFFRWTLTRCYQGQLLTTRNANRYRTNQILCNLIFIASCIIPCNIVFMVFLIKQILRGWTDLYTLQKPTSRVRL